MAKATGAPASRAALLFVVWLGVAGWQVKDIPIGLAAAAVATFVSLNLVPPGPLKLRFGALATLILRFLRGSVAAGINVARRALAPKLDLRPDFLSCELRLPEGPAQSGFCAMASLQPGALPTGRRAGALLVHALDTRLPVRQNLAQDEALFMRAFGYE